VTAQAVTAPNALPVVSSTSPQPNATGWPTNRKITATFTQEMAPATITTATFTLKQGSTLISGTVTYFSHRAAIFTPQNDLASNATFTATLTTGVTSQGGTALARDYVWSFMTGPGRDTTAPTVLSTVPTPDNVTGVAPNQAISVTFSEVMDPSTITGATFTIQGGTTPVTGGACYYAGRTAMFVPGPSLAPNTTFTATITTGAQDLAGNALANNFVWHFTTGGAPNNGPPTVVSVSPADAGTGVSLQPPLAVTFSEPMRAGTLTTATFTLKRGLAPVVGTVIYADGTATFSPAVALAPCSTYAAAISTGVQDLAGNALATTFVWHFTTGVAAVPLGAAAPFAVLAGSAVSNTLLLTTVNGDLGVSPTPAISNFPPGVVNGTIHAADPVAAQAQLALTKAYNAAAARSCSPVPVAGNLGGQILYPGVYKSTSSLEISSGDLTLDARGDANAVFIFEMASTLTTTSGRQVILAGDAQPANIYWQVGSSATLGTTSVFQGNILAYASITLDTGATLTGRALAQTGAVSLDGNTITRP
jgi:hypothetical protein